MLAAATLAVMAMAGCGDSGSYELSWTIGCDRLPADECEVTSVRQCSSVGIDIVEVRAFSGDEVTVSNFPCFADGPLGRGPGLPGGSTRLEVSGLSPGAQTLTGPISRTVEVPDDGYVPVSVDLPLPAACSDGVDNDADGLVDGFDPDCAGEADDDEAQ